MLTRARGFLWWSSFVRPGWGRQQPRGGADREQEPDQAEARVSRTLSARRCRRLPVRPRSSTFVADLAYESVGRGQLYLDALDLLSLNKYRLGTRRYIQELFERTPITVDLLLETAARPPSMALVKRRS